MKYSLRSLMFVALVAPALLAGAWLTWLVISAEPTAGSPAAMRAFLKTIRYGTQGQAEIAAKNCFIIDASGPSYNDVLHECTNGSKTQDSPTDIGTISWVVIHQGKEMRAFPLRSAETRG